MGYRTFTQKMWRSKSENEAEAFLVAVKEFVVGEMKVGEEAFDEMEMEKVFAPAREAWNTLYIKFASESSVHKLYSYTRNMKTNLRLVPYIPKQFYHRYKDLESMAYNLRHSESKYKTRVKMGTSDLVLYKRKPSENYWTVVPSSPDIHPAILSKYSTSPDQQIKSTSNVQLNLRPNSGFTSKQSNQE